MASALWSSSSNSDASSMGSLRWTTNRALGTCPPVSGPNAEYISSASAITARATPILFAKVSDGLSGRIVVTTDPRIYVVTNPNIYTAEDPLPADFIEYLFIQVGVVTSARGFDPNCTSRFISLPMNE